MSEDIFLNAVDSVCTSGVKVLSGAAEANAFGLVIQEVYKIVYLKTPRWMKAQSQIDSIATAGEALAIAKKNGDKSALFIPLAVSALRGMESKSRKKALRSRRKAKKHKEKKKEMKRREKAEEEEEKAAEEEEEKEAEEKERETESKRLEGRAAKAKEIEEEGKEEEALAAQEKVPKKEENKELKKQGTSRKHHRHVRMQVDKEESRSMPDLMGAGQTEGLFLSLQFILLVQRLLIKQLHTLWKDLPAGSVAMRVQLVSLVSRMCATSKKVEKHLHLSVTPCVRKTWKSPVEQLPPEDVFIALEDVVGRLRNGQEQSK
jgi:hypothetical protein